MSTLERLGADDLRRVVTGFRDALRSHQEIINRLNVYPVPDGDTGTNMALTLESVLAEIAEAGDTDLAGTCRAVSHGSLMGARGNSGVLLSGILRGLAVTIDTADGLDGPTLARGLRAASDGAYSAVPRPVEGTILTVIREAAEAAEAAVDDPGAGGVGLVAVAEAARTRGYEALARTPELLPVLKDAGVVDSGGTGLLLLLDALLHVADGRPLPEPPAVADSPAPDLDALHAHADHRPHDEMGHDVGELRYEVMYFLEAPDDAIGAFKKVWAGMGDSIVVVGGDGVWNCHIHTDDIGASIEAAIDIGRPCKIRVTDLLEEVEEERWVRDAPADDDQAPSAERVTTGVVAVATGDGIRRIFGSLGVQGIVTGGQSMNPSTHELLAAVEAVAADGVVILPNNKNIVPVAEQVAAHSSKTVLVVPTRGIAEGFAALICYDPEDDAEANAEAMAEAASSIVAGEVTRAVRASTCDVGPIAEGDFLGIGREGIRAVEPDLAAAVVGLLGVLLADEHEMVTLIEGEGATAGSTRTITEWLHEHHADVECEVHHGGQPLYPYYLGVE